MFSFLFFFIALNPIALWSAAAEEVVHLPELNASWANSPNSGFTESIHDPRSKKSIRKPWNPINRTPIKAPKAGVGAVVEAPRNSRGVKLSNAEGVERTGGISTFVLSSAQVSKGSSASVELGQSGLGNSGARNSGVRNLGVRNLGVRWNSSENSDQNGFSFRASVIHKVEDLNLVDPNQQEVSNSSDQLSKQWRADFFRDTNSPLFIDEKGTPYTSSDDEKMRLPTRHEGFRIAYDSNPSDYVLKFRKGTRRSGILNVGEEQEWGFLTSHSFNLFDARNELWISPYASAGIDRFQKKMGTLNGGFSPVVLSTLPERIVNQDAKIGVILSKNLDFNNEVFKLEPQLRLESERLWREAVSGPNRYRSKYSRNEIEGSVHHRLLPFKLVELISNWSLTYIKDPEAAAIASPQVLEKLVLFPQKKWKLMGEVSVEVNSATPLQRFGDGVLIQPNHRLKSEKKQRASAGPEWEHAGRKWSVGYFREQTKRTPLLVGTTPTSAKYLSVSGVWAQGVFSRFDWGMHKDSGFSGSSGIEWQEALQDTDVSWQRGKPMPGRPKVVADLRLELEPQVLWSTPWGVWTELKYRAGEFRDLSGSLELDPRFVFNAGIDFNFQKTAVGVPKKIRLKGSDLLAKAARSESLRVAGAAGEQVLDPELPERKVALELDWNW